MRVVVISDIHGNAAALEAVLAQPHDVLVCLGDLVGYGPAPGDVVRRVRAEATLVLQGNHDRALADGVTPGCRAAFEHLARATSSLGSRQLSPEETAYLGSFPRSALRIFDGVSCLFVHATPSDPLYRYLPDEAEQWQREVAGLNVDLIVVDYPVDLTIRALGAAHLPQNVTRQLADLLRSGQVPENLDPHELDR